MTTRALVLSDTHMPERSGNLPESAVQAARDADLIFHLGDFTALEVATFLESFAPVIGVHGNNDSEVIRRRYPEQKKIEIEGHSIALLHGHQGGSSALRAARRFSEVEVVLFGHSHRPFVAREHGRLLLNPGSPTDKRWSPYRAFAWLNLGHQISASIVALT